MFTSLSLRLIIVDQFPFLGSFCILLYIHFVIKLEIFNSVTIVRITHIGMGGQSPLEFDKFTN